MQFLRPQLKFSLTLREKCPYSEFFRSVFSRIRAEYVSLRIQSKCGKIRTKHGHFLHSVNPKIFTHYKPILSQCSVFIPVFFGMCRKYKNGAFRSSRPEVFWKKSVLKNFKIHRKTPVPGSPF